MEDGHGGHLGRRRGDEHLPPYDPGAEARRGGGPAIRGPDAERTEKIDRLAGGAAVADTPERLAKRTDRLRRYQAGEQLRVGRRWWCRRAHRVRGRGRRPIAAPRCSSGSSTAPTSSTSATWRRAWPRPGPWAGSTSATRSGRVVGYGTASLVSTQLILTNHHVLPTADVARWSAIEFNYQDGIDGQPLQPRLFRLDPDRFYLADKEHDFALVAVAAAEAELAAFGFNRLIDVEGKAVVGEFVTIVQHPKGEKKQVSLRENRVVDLLDSFLHYETDTEPGSSGSPVFNDQWEVVALHHASVPAPDHAELGHIMNEGIRVSARDQGRHAPSAAGLPAPMRQPASTGCSRTSGRRSGRRPSPVRPRRS